MSSLIIMMFAVIQSVYGHIVGGPLTIVAKSPLLCG